MASIGPAILVVLLLYLVFVIPVGAVILRAAVSFANRMVGGSVRPETASPPGNIPSDPTNPFSAPQVQAVVTSTGEAAIPEPSFGKAYGITLANAIAGGVVGVVIGLVTSPMGNLVSQVVSIAVSLPLAALILSTVLPTTFLRGLLVCVMQMVVILIVAAVVGVVAGIVFSVA